MNILTSGDVIMLCAIRGRQAAILRAESKPHYQRHRQEGGELCRAGQRDGVVCPEDECDIDSGLRNEDPAP